MLITSSKVHHSTVPIALVNLEAHSQMSNLRTSPFFGSLMSKW